MNAIVAHLTIAVVSIIALVVLNVWGTPNEALNIVLSTALGAGGWGAIQRQQEPVNKLESENGKV